MRAAMGAASGPAGHGGRTDPLSCHGRFFCKIRYQKFSEALLQRSIETPRTDTVSDLLGVCMAECATGDSGPHLSQAS